jgi:thiol-disulfide isomerase/thioredoxin
MHSIKAPRCDRPGALSLALSLCLTALGCAKQESNTPARTPAEPATRQTTAPPEAAAAAPVLALPDASGAPSGDLSEADRAWLEVLNASRQPPPPAEWRTNEPSREAIQAWNRRNSELAAEAADKARAFYTKYPEHAQVDDARRRELYLLRAAVNLGNTNQLARLVEVENERLKDPSLDEDDRFELRTAQVQRAALDKRGEGQAAVLAEFERGVRALQKEFPQRTETYAMLLELAQNAAADKARALAQELTAEAVPAEIQSEAKVLLKRLDALGRPLEIKFTAVDGREVDLAALKGKVVLVDFWATWCGPCVQELPNVKAAYQKFHDRGFEIIGISFDDEKDALTQFVAKEQMPWPQYFEAGAEHRFGRAFEVTSIPTMWLVDRQGRLRELNARDDLAGKVETLLAETP